MNDDILLTQLEELAEKLGIAVRHENVTMEEISGAGGLCRIRGQYILILHSRATMKEKIQVMADALRRFDFSNVYIRPVLRGLLEGPEE